MPKPRLIEGGIFADERGEVRFINEFNFSEITRFYQIKQSSTDVVRAWQGHKVEQKWFYCIAGSFRINLIGVDDWINPSEQLLPISFELNSRIPMVLHVPGGYANGFKALEENSIFLIYSDKTLEEAKNDEYRFPVNYWGFR